MRYKKSIFFILIFVVAVFFINFSFSKDTASTKNEKNPPEDINNFSDDGEPAIEKKYSKIFSYFPIKKETSLPELGEKAGIAVLFSEDGREEILYEKNIDEKTSFASLVKLMSAIIVVDNYSMDRDVKVSPKAVWTLGESGRLSPGEIISVGGLLDISLLVSSNDAVAALAEVMGEKKFIEAMNKKADEINLLNTSFSNPHGLDEDEKDIEDNLSSAYELALMTQYSVIHYPEIWEILGIKEKDVFGKDSASRQTLHHLRNTNKLIEKEFVLGGKTGYTENAGDAMILAMEAPGEVDGNIIIVLLGLGIGERIPKTDELYNWLFDAYEWK